MKKFCLGLIFVICSLFMVSVSYADDNVRVGIEKYFKGVNSISINNNDVNVYVNNKAYSVAENGGYTMSHISKNYYKLNSNFSTYSEVVENMTSFTGYSCIPVLNDDGWSIYFTTDKKPNADVASVTTGSFAILFSNNGVNKFITDTSSPVQIDSSSGIMDLQKASYRDKLELFVSSGLITGINVIEREHYLYGVINSEMPSSWHIEAQKAQAVAARTYIVSTGNKHKYYDLCDNINCQDYNGTAKETENGRKAVDETRGMVAYYNNEPISAVYFSSDGGATQNSQDVWMSAVPYLIGIKDEYEKECMEWSRTYTYSDITSICNTKGFGIGSVNKVEAEYNDLGICVGLTFVGSSGSKTVTKEEVRTVFNASSEGSLPSRNFVIDSGEEVTVPTVYTLGKDGTNSVALNNIVAENGAGEGNKIENQASTYNSSSGKGVISVQKSGSNSSKVVINGRGFGHGVGMSQYGAKGMAEAGYKYTDILKFYYKGVEIK
ncbi:MAG: SpoIID/LytB domain-containing protein [Lachnospirales bacterium]